MYKGLLQKYPIIIDGCSRVHPTRAIPEKKVLLEVEGPGNFKLNSGQSHFYALIGFHKSHSQFTRDLGPCINGLVTDGNTQLYCLGYILALFQSTTGNKICSEHTQDYKRLLPVFRAYIYELQSKELQFSHLFMLIFDDFLQKVPKIAK